MPATPPSTGAAETQSYLTCFSAFSEFSVIITCVSKEESCVAIPTSIIHSTWLFKVPRDVTPQVGVWGSPWGGGGLSGNPNPKAGQAAAPSADPAELESPSPLRAPKDTSRTGAELGVNLKPPKRLRQHPEPQSRSRCGPETVARRHARTAWRRRKGQARDEGRRVSQGVILRPQCGIQAAAPARLARTRAERA